VTAGSVIESTNFVVALVALYGVVQAFIWRAKNHLSQRNVAIVVAWLWIFVGVGIQAAWFGISRHLAHEGDVWLKEMYEMRVGIKVLSMIMFSWGMFAFVRLIDGVRCVTQVGLFASIVTVSFLHYYLY